MKKNKKNKQQINYLDLIPVRPEKLGWHIDRRERVVLEVKNEGRPSERTFWRSSRAAVSKNCEIFSDFRELSFYQF